MLNLDEETPLSLSEAPAALPSRPHVSTLHRWRLRGIRGVKLETCLIGGRRYTSREALERFIARVTAQDRESTESSPRCESEQITRELDRLKL